MTSPVVESGAEGSLLAELLVALALLSIGLLAIAGLFTIGAAQSSAAADLGLAATLAAEQAELLRSLPLDSLRGGAETVTRNRLQFQRTWTIDKDLPQPGLTAVAVTVTPLRRVGVVPSGIARMRFQRAR